MPIAADALDNVTVDRRDGAARRGLQGGLRAWRAAIAGWPAPAQSRWPLARVCGQTGVDVRAPVCVRHAPGRVEP
jgi:hypothetical protein